MQRRDFLLVVPGLAMLASLPRAKAAPVPCADGQDILIERTSARKMLGRAFPFTTCPAGLCNIDHFHDENDKPVLRLPRIECR